MLLPFLSLDVEFAFGPQFHGVGYAVRRGEVVRSVCYVVTDTSWASGPVMGWRQGDTMISLDTTDRFVTPTATKKV